MVIDSRHPRRISITVNHALYEQLMQASDHQGRSLSNYAAFLLETALERSLRVGGARGPQRVD
ncbi:MAG: hypothetical protein EBX49_01400 [Synechococcaceae bacterium WB8_1B_136]|nr:hypothetical protein [Synechococcaceae bacterium WB8_1B_136]